MNHLFFVRHGAYNRKEELIDVGIAQMVSAGEKITRVTSNIGKMLVSTAPWAVQSGICLAEHLGFDPESIVFDDFLYQGPRTPFDAWVANYPGIADDKLIEMINKSGELGEGGVIVLSHHTMVNRFPSVYVNKQFGEKSNSLEPEKGAVIHVDMKNSPHYRGII